MNLSQLAVAICKKEGGKVNLSIGQVKEVIKCFFEVLVEMGDKDITEPDRFIGKYYKYYKNKKR